jgi:hypothetical protein
MASPVPPGFHTLTPHINVKGAAQFIDPFGFTWAIATHKEDVTPEELKKRQAAAFGG